MDIKNKFIHQNGLGYVIRESVILIFDTYWTERNTYAYKLSFSAFSFLQPDFETFLDFTSKKIGFLHYKHWSENIRMINWIFLVLEELGFPYPLNTTVGLGDDLNMASA